MPTSSLTRRPVRRALVAAVALVAAPLAMLPATPAQAADAPALQWKVSTYVATSFSLSSHRFDDGASEDANKIVTFPNGVGSYNAATGSSVITYAGSLTAYQPGTTVDTLSVTIASPRVVTRADGSGYLSAVVSAANAAGGGSDAASTTPKRVVVTRFSASSTALDGTRRTLSATPGWENVLAPNSAQATALGLAADRPYEGKSFAPEFLEQITPGARAFFYKSSNAPSSQTTQEGKAPAAFTSVSDPIAAAATITSSTYAGGVQVSVTGSGFSAETQTGDAGVYVGIAESGGLPDVTSMDAMSSFAAAAYLPSVPSGALSTTLTAPTAKLDSTKTYSVYTWQAHSHSTTTQDTVTALPIDFATLSKPADPVVSTPAAVGSTVAASWVKKPKVKKAGQLKVTVSSSSTPSGTVTVTLTKKKVTKSVTGVLGADGTTVIKVPKLKKTGKWKVSVAYGGSPTVLASQSDFKVRSRR